MLVEQLLGQPGVNNQDGEEHIADLPFDPSKYGLVHLPPLPPSGPINEQEPSAVTSSHHFESSSRAGQGSSLTAFVAPISSLFTPLLSTAQYHATLTTQLEPSVGGTSSRGGSSKYESASEKRSQVVSSPSHNEITFSRTSSPDVTHSSLESEQSLLTGRFQYRVTEEGHHVIVGREGKLERCEDEPIRTPGAVQSFGVLIAVDQLHDTLVVRQVSENSAELLGLPPKYLFGLKCFTDTLPDDQIGILWDNIQFLSEPAMRSEGEEGSPHVFLLKGYGAPGSAIPNEGESEDGKLVWTCWCAVHRAEVHSSVESVKPGPLVMEFELQQDLHNPLYPAVAASSTSGTASPASSMTESSTVSDGPDWTLGGRRDLDLSGSEAPSIMPSSPGLEGDEDWIPSAEEIIESTTSFSKPLPALERLRRMTRGGPSHEATPGLSSRRPDRHSRSAASTGGMMDIFAVMAQMNEQLGSAPDLEIFLKIAVGIIKDLTQFHRILVYQFDETWNGQVVSELLDWNQSHDLYRGLHFPASDIPIQARELYKINKVRLLYDRGQQTARIVVRNKDDLETPINMTHSYLRAMSPIHVKYLGNMGVRASMSVSIMAFGQLWGLVMCHSYGDHGMRVSFPVRQILRLLSQSISKNIERLSYAERLHTRKMAGYIVSNADDLLNLFDADFGILVIGEGAKILGANQHGQETFIMAEYLRLKQFTTIQASQAVVNDYQDLSLTTGGLEVIAGLLYVPLSREGKDFIAFMRKGQRRKVKWAGKPYKDGQDQNKLEPRRSFKIWSETITKRCRMWTNEQLETAGVLALVYGKALWREKDVLQTTRITNILLSNASHEGMPPTYIIFFHYLELALDGPLDAETRDNLIRSHAASKSLLFAINDLLDLTRLENGNEISFNKPFDLKTAIKDACHLYKNEAERRKLTFTLDLIDSPTIVIGNSQKICTVIQNLTANSLKYTTEGSITVSCTSFNEPEGLRNPNQIAVEILVADTGCGIHSSKIEKMLREFHQTESSEPKSNAEAGVGLGLAVVARIVGQLGGRLRMDSAINQGSTFSFLIPLSLPSEDPMMRASASAHFSSSRALNQSGGSRPQSLFAHSSGGNEMEQFVHALSTSNMSGPSQPASNAKIKEIETPHKVIHRSPSIGVFELVGSQYPVHPVKIDEFARPQPKSSPVFEEILNPHHNMNSAQKKELAEANSSRGKLRILIVEDNEINRRLMAKRLSIDGHIIVTTTNGQEALDLVTADRGIDLILMDIQMPILNGFDTTRAIRKVEKKQPHVVLRSSHALNGRIPIFAFSASLREVQCDELADYDLDGWILKPINFKRLRILLEGILDPMQREKDVYKPGYCWEAGGWLAKR
ncbi:hypothetical protein CPB83DRAFT_756080 [Crepidotus variabilis]|uniref:Phytochrome n=1 Tax=Crepidotus variabilis TaxID=179855 RepID=A0A9P6ESV1_9AGAR|nr:hypothetical protein CPB83DRAFT_756080 [Crepidotus variabilis]